MDILSLTSTDQIRAVLTVSEEDLPEETLVAYGLEDDLGENLDKWYSGWEAETGAPLQRKLRLYAKYFCAATVAGMAQTFILKKMTDGANEGQRSDIDGFAHLAVTLWGKAAAVKEDILDILDPSRDPAPYGLIGVVRPARDVITEGR